MTRKPLDLAGLLAAQADEYVDVQGVGQFRLRSLDAAGKLRVLAAVRRLSSDDDGTIEDQAAKLELGIELLSLAIVDADGVPCFDSAEGRAAIARLPLNGLQELIDVATRISGVAKSDAEDIEGAEKNYETATN